MDLLSRAVEPAVFLADRNVVGIGLYRHNETVFTNNFCQQQRNHALVSAHIKHSRPAPQLSLLQQLKLRKNFPIVVIPARSLRIGQEHLQLLVAEHVAYSLSRVRLNATLDSQHAKLRPETAR